MSSYLLFARPSFISGMARVLDLGTFLNEYNSYTLPVQADHYALKSDWQKVGNDLMKAMELHEKSLNSHVQE